MMRYDQCARSQAIKLAFRQQTRVPRHIGLTRSFRRRYIQARAAIELGFGECWSSRKTSANREADPEGRPCPLRSEHIRGHIEIPSQATEHQMSLVLILSRGYVPAAKRRACGRHPAYRTNTLTFEEIVNSEVVFSAWFVVS